MVKLKLSTRFSKRKCFIFLIIGSEHTRGNLKPRPIKGNYPSLRMRTMGILESLFCQGFGSNQITSTSFSRIKSGPETGRLGGETSQVQLFYEA